MKRSLLFTVALVAMVTLGFNPPTANAQGAYFQAGGLGQSHLGFYGGYASYYPAQWGGNYGGRSYCNGSHWGGAHRWHDTSHYDYHPADYVPHYNHYHYVPAHYDVHHTGHWDHWHD